MFGIYLKGQKNKVRITQQRAIGNLLISQSLEKGVSRNLHLFERSDTIESLKDARVAHELRHVVNAVDSFSIALSDLLGFVSQLVRKLLHFALMIQGLQVLVEVDASRLAANV